MNVGCISLRFIANRPRSPVLATSDMNRSAMNMLPNTLPKIFSFNKV